MKSGPNQERGAAVVEFALLFGVLLIFLAGIVEFGFLWVESNYIASAAREGARVAAKVPGDDAAAISARQASAETAVEDYLRSSFLFNNVFENPDYASQYADFVSTSYADTPLKDPAGNNISIDGELVYMADVMVTVKTEYIWQPILWPLLSAIIPGTGFDSDKLTQLSQSASFAIEKY